MSLPGIEYGSHMDSAVESMQTAAKHRGDAMRFLSLIVGLVLGFLAAAWFYGAGGALAIAGRQIGPDIVLHEEVHSQGSGRTIVGAPDGSSGFGTPSGSSGSAGASSDSPPSESAQEQPLSGPNEKPVSGGNSYIQLRWPK
jgi:hypothetical protein